MTAALLSALGWGFLSAFVPFTPVEPYLVALAATGQPVVAVGVAAAVGQTAGKVLIFLAARKLWRLPRWMKRPRTNRFLTFLDRPALVVPTILVSAVTGVPPLLVVSVHAARTKVSTPMFAVCCLAGRALRFVGVMLIPELL